MKQLYQLSFLFMLLFAFPMQNLVAAVKLVRISSSVSKKSLLDKGTVYAVISNGGDVEVSDDGAGGTNLIVNGETITLSDLREAFNVENLEWENISVALAGEQCNADDHKTTLKMTGGVLGAIYAGVEGPFEGEMKGSIDIIITGGTINYISGGNIGFRNSRIANNLKVSIYLSGMKYTGNSNINLCQYETVQAGSDEYTSIKHYIDNLIVRKDCEFSYDEVKFTEEDLKTPVCGSLIEDMNGTVIYCNTVDKVFTIPEYAADISTQTLRVIPATYSYVYNCTISNNANITVTKCGGYTGNDTWLNKQPVYHSKHNYESKVLKKATCQPGTNAYVCSYCHEYRYYDTHHEIYTEITDPTDEHQIVKIPARDATCLTDGHTEEEICIICGYIQVQSESIPKTDHEWITDTSKETECGGYIMRCKNCDAEWVTNPKYHEWHNDETVGGSCTEYSYHQNTCKVCGAKQKFPSDMLGHQFVEHSKNATCTEDGHETYYTCSVCNLYFANQYSEGVKSFTPTLIPATGHNFTQQVAEHALLSPATCESAARYYYSCSNNGCTELDYANIFVDGEPTGSEGNHVYRILSIDYIDKEMPESGNLTIECDICKKRMKNLPFSMLTTSNSATLPSTESKLVEVLEEPTCQPGRGKYRVKLTFGDRIVNREYEAPIPPVYELNEKDDFITDEFGNPNQYILHAWDKDGMCKHHKSKIPVKGFYRYKKSVKLDADHTFEYYYGKAFTDIEEMKSDPLLSDDSALELESAIVAPVDLSSSYTAPFSNDYISTNATYEREVTGGKIETLILPMEIPVSCINGTVYKLNDFDANNNILKFEKYTNENIERDTPYIILVNKDATSLIDNSKLEGKSVLCSGSETLHSNETYVGITRVIAAQKGYYKPAIIQPALNEDRIHYYYNNDSRQFEQYSISRTIPAFHTDFYINKFSDIQPKENVLLQLGTGADAIYILYDLNGDGSVDIADVTTLIKDSNMDLNGDGKFDIQDIRAIADKILKKK